MSQETLPIRRNRRWRWIAALAFAAVALTVLSIFVLPTFAARWILDSKLEDFGLQASGIETVDIDIWNSEIRFGPLAIGAPGAPPARLERFGLKFSLSRLFDRRGLGKETFVEGLIVEVARDAKGRILVNGVDVFALLPPPTEAPPPSEEADAGEPWGVGLQRFTLRDSQLRFKRHDGGELEMDIEQLVLDGFRTWRPDAPGKFALKAAVNGMTLQLDGEAKPFSDRIEVQATSKIAAVELSKVQRFTGRLPLTRGDGILQAALKHSAILAPDGTIQLSNSGKIDAEGLSVSLPEGPEISFANAQIQLDTAQIFRPDGRIGLTGSLETAGQQARLAMPDGSTVELDKATVKLDDMKLDADVAQTLTGSLSLKVSAAGGEARQDERILKFKSVSLGSKFGNVSVAPSGRVGAKFDASLKLESPELAGDAQGNAERISVALSDADISAAKAAFTFTGGVAVDVSALEAATERTAEAPSMTLKAKLLKLSDSRIEMTIPEEAALSWRARIGLEALETALSLEGEQPGSIAIDRLQLNEGAIDDGLQAAFKSLQIDGVTASATKLPLSSTETHPGNAKISRIRLEDGALDLAARSTLGRLEFDGLAVTVDGYPAAVNGTESGFSAKVGEIRAEGGVWDADGALSLQAISLATLETALRGAAPFDARLDGLQLKSLSLSAEQIAGADSVVLTGFEAAMDGGQALKLSFADVAIDKVTGSSTPTVKIGAVDVKGLELAASSKLLPAEDADAKAVPASDANEAAAALPQIAIGRFTLSNPARIMLSDTRQSPAVTVDTEFTRFELRDIDTVKADKTSSVALAATINEFTDLTVDGTFDLAGDGQNVDLKTSFKNLELPPFSRYAATYLGVNLESGRLSAEADGKVAGGALDVATKLNILNLRFSPLSPEDAKRLSAAAGVPVETAVGLLEDKDGRIELSIPVKGDLQNPDFQIDAIISKAVGNAIVGTIGTTLKVMFPPALLLSVIDSATSGSGIKFAPAPFDAGTTTLQPKGVELVDTLAKLLKERPKLTVTLCGRATAEDLNAVLKPDVDKVLAERRAAYAQAMAAYQARESAAKKPPASLPEKPNLDEDSIVADLAAAQADKLRNSLTALAGERTKAIRLDLAERLKVASGRVAECRSVYDPADKGVPRAEFGL